MSKHQVRKAEGTAGVGTVDAFTTRGLTGVVRFGGHIYEEWHPRLQGVMGVRVYREMRDNDAVIGAAVNLTQSVLRQVRWKAEPADGSDEARAAAEFLEDVLGDMNHTWADFMSEVVSMLWFGWALFEQTMKRRPDGRVGLEEVAIRAQETLDEWEFSPEGDVLGMWQYAYPRMHRVFIPMHKSVLFRTESNKDSPEGRSLLRNCYRSWYYLKRLQELEAIGIERDAVGLPVIELPWEYLQTNASTDKTQARNNFAKLLQQIRRNEHEGVLFPPEVDREGKPTGFRLRLLQSGGSRQLSVTEPIQRYQREIAMLFSTQFQFLGQPGSSGSWSLSSDQTDLYGLSLGAILDNIQETFHLHVTRRLFEFNGIPGHLVPTWKHGDVEKQDVLRFADMLTKLIDAGVVTADPALEEHVRDEVGLPPRAEAENEPTPEELDAARRAAAVADTAPTAAVMGPAEPPPVGPEPTAPVLKGRALAAAVRAAAPDLTELGRVRAEVLAADLEGCGADHEH